MECVAWDEERWGMSYEKFRKEIEATRDDMLWFYSEIARLRKTHLGKWIAVKDKRILSSGRNYESFMTELKKKGDLARVQIFFVAPDNFVDLL